MGILTKAEVVGSMKSLPIWFNELLTLAQSSAQVALEARRRLDKLKVQEKADGSAVSELDLSLHEHLRAGLKRMMPAMKYISEEDPKLAELAQPWQKFWLVDPLDGTRNFLEGSDEFCINIAYMQDNQPSLGVVIAPALNKIYYGGPGYGAFCNGEPMQARPVSRHLRALVSYTDNADGDWLPALQAAGYDVEQVPSGSALKLCLLAEGEADLYPRMSALMEWDLAAPLAILRAVGGDIRHLDGSALQFNKAGWRCPAFIATADASLMTLALAGSQGTVR